MKRRIILAVVALIAPTLVWFLAVDFSVFHESCPDCHSDRDIGQYRVFGYPVREDIFEHPSSIERVSADLDVPCSHANRERWHANRLWGLCICACPCHRGIVRLSDDLSWYDEHAVAEVKSLAAANPGLAEEFRSRVLVEHDLDYWRAFMDKLRGANENADER